MIDCREAIPATDMVERRSEVTMVRFSAVARWTRYPFPSHAHGLVRGLAQWFSPPRCVLAARDWCCDAGGGHDAAATSRPRW